MTLKNRKEIEAHFKNGSIPSETQFFELIGSMLNLRDDKFLGYWREGIACQVGDVVIYGDAIWTALDDGTVKGSEFCSKDPPGINNPKWRQLSDADWTIVDEAAASAESRDGADSDPVPATMHANLRVTRVGIGTENPEARLDVLESKIGRFMVILERDVSPTLKVIHSETRRPDNFLAMVVDKDAVVFAADSHSGFEFRAAEESCMHHTRHLLRIQPEGHRLDVSGECRAYGYFVHTDASQIDPETVEALGSMHQKLHELKPVTFRFNASTGNDPEVTQIGFIAQDVAEVLPEAVRIVENGDGESTMSVACHALVPVLVKAMQAQTSETQQLADQIQQLADRIAAQQSQIEQLEERLNLLEEKPSSPEAQPES